MHEGVPDAPAFEGALGAVVETLPVDLQLVGAGNEGVVLEGLEHIAVEFELSMRSSVSTSVRLWSSGSSWSATERQASISVARFRTLSGAAC